MILKFREAIIGARDDYDLAALNGIIEWLVDESVEIDQRIIERCIDSFEQSNPSFRWASCEVCQ